MFLRMGRRGRLSKQGYKPLEFGAIADRKRGIKCGVRSRGTVAPTAQESTKQGRSDRKET
jgi:hypothetical protein